MVVDVGLNSSSSDFQRFFAIFPSFTRHDVHIQGRNEEKGNSFPILAFKTKAFSGPTTV